jgi:hypothetical protein
MNSDDSTATPKLQFEGYHEPQTLPVKKGDTITLQKGMKYQHLAEDRVVKRKYKIKVYQVLPGITRKTWEDEPLHSMNPTIRWAGSGGYWSAIDINEYLNWEPRK